MKTIKYIGIANALLITMLSVANADERRFTYTYEPETLPEGAYEFENWITLRTQKNKFVKKSNYTRWDLRQEIEYGVTDQYTVALYLNEKVESYRDTSSQSDFSKVQWKGVSLENRYNLLNPATHFVGLTAYLEGRYSGEEAEIEQKIILGQRYGSWKWALNLIHETEWEDNFHEKKGVVGLSFGVARDISKRWSLGIELLSESVIPEYKKFDNTALFIGPVVSYHQEKWWMALTVLPQVHGWNHIGNPDNDSSFELKNHERLNIRLLFGINF